MYKQIFSVFLLLAAAVTIIIFAYYVTITIGKRMNKLLEGRHTQVLERSIIGIGANITILKINQKIYIVMMQGKTIKLLDIIEENDWRSLNNKNKTRFNIQNTNNGFLMDRLFNKVKKSINNDRYNRNGSDNNEQYKV